MEQIGPQDMQAELDRLSNDSIDEHLTRVQAALEGAEAAGDTDRAERLRAEQRKWIKFRDSPRR